MDPLIGAALAAAVAWISIVLVAVLPGRPLPRKPLRIVGGGSVGLLGLGILGAPISAFVPLAFLAGGIAGVWLAAKPA